MIYCEKCGAPLDDDAIFCLKCGASVAQESGDAFGDFDLENEFGYNPGQAGYADFGTNRSPNNYGDRTKEVANQLKDAAKKAAGVAADAVKANVEQRKIINSQAKKVNLAEDETVIRSYEVTRVFLLKTPGKLTVTNKRIIFSASNGSSKVFMSTPIDSVGSIQIFTGRSFNLIAFIFAGIFFLLSAVSSAGAAALNSFNFYGSTSEATAGAGIAGGVFLLIAIAIIVISLRKSMYLSISAVNSSPGLVIGKNNTVGSAFYAIRGSAGIDANKVMSELSAMILDLQQFGDNAIEKWKK